MTAAVFEPTMSSLASHLPTYSLELESVPDQRAAVDVPAARKTKACPQSQPFMHPVVFASYDVDQRPWPAMVPFDATDSLNVTKGHEQYQFGYTGSFEPNVPAMYDDEDNLSEEFEDCPLSTSTVANSPISELSSNHHHQQYMNNYPGMDLDHVAAATTATAALGSEEYPSPIFSGDNSGCAPPYEYYYPHHLDHIPPNEIPLPLTLPDQPYLPDSWSPFLARDNAEAQEDIKESTAILPEKESFLPTGKTDTASMVASPTHVLLHAPRPMRIENTAAHLAALVEREESKLEAQERDESLVDTVLAPKSRTADQLSPLTAPAHLVPYAHLYTQQQPHQAPVSQFPAQPVTAHHPLPSLTSELPRRRIQPILELDTSGRTVQLRQSMRARRHARNLSVPMSADALQYRPVGWKGRQDVVGQNPHVLVQDQYAYGAWDSSSRSVDWTALGGDFSFLPPPAHAYSQPEPYAPAALY